MGLYSLPGGESSPAVPDWCVGALGPTSAAARLSGVTEARVCEWATAGKIRSERRGKNTFVRLDDVARLAAVARDLDPPAPLTRRLEDHRRRRATAPGLLPGFHDGTAEGGGTL
jgi:hypothetical protein